VQRIKNSLFNWGARFPLRHIQKRIGICNARKNDRQSCVDNIGTHMVQSLGENLEENLRA